MGKKLGILGVVAVVGFWFWVAAEPWVHSETKFRDPSVWILPVIMLVILGAMTAMAYLLLPRKRLGILLAFLLGGTYLAVFGRDYLQIIVLFIFPLFHIFAIRNIRLESRERLKIHPGFIMKRGITMVMLPFYMALSFAYFQSPSIQENAQNQRLSPTFKQIAVEVADKFLEDQEWSQAEKHTLRNLAIEQAYDSVIRIFDSYRAYFPPILAFGLFLILWGLGFVFHRVSAWIGMLIFLVLRKTGFVRIEVVQVPSEFIKL